MKPTTLPKTLSLILLCAFLSNLPLGFSNDVEQVVDINGNPIFPGGKYYLVPAIVGPPGGGVRLGRTGNSHCPVTVLQEFSEVQQGSPVKFSIPGISPGIIFTGTPLDIEFTETPDCAESPNWVAFVDNEIQKACLGIGGPEQHPGQQTIDGKFHIEKYRFGYKLVFCIRGSDTCFDIGTYDAHKGEGGRRLNLTEHAPFEVVFVEASHFDAVIKSVA
ncbi:kunitz-type trypsin inhibitor-like 2 protein [Abrus precatorius]|uniref:Kunitz-type trypsin inhibitor-like 2 protein n=1 Tax=Abrus precatorius TaxID=3816 RepID=A0A8B8LR02_ABRPR|nr:kunitz-type trypsin inhibitor-like 2 protein [Abrus precatorius]